MWWNLFWPTVSLGLSAYNWLSRPKFSGSFTPPQVIPPQPVPPPPGWGPITVREPTRLPDIVVPPTTIPGQTIPVPSWTVPTAPTVAPPGREDEAILGQAWRDLQSRAGWGGGGFFTPQQVALGLGYLPSLYPQNVWEDFLFRATRG